MRNGTVEANLLAKYGEYQVRFEHLGGYEMIIRFSGFVPASI
jgi:hypothetical protein